MATTEYIWDELSDNLLMETDENGATAAVYTNEPVRYGNLISQRRAGATSYYHFDGQHSARQLTDASQNLTDSYTFSAFGETVAKTGTTTNPFGYKGALGYYANPEVDDLYVRRRTYDPVTPRWVSPDPAGFLDSLNLYVYAKNSPLTYTDPLGLFCVRTLDPTECSDCVKDLLKNDPTIKTILEIMDELNKKGGRPKCKVQAFCCKPDSTDERCKPCQDNKTLLGQLLDSKFDRAGTSFIILCSERFLDLSGSADFPKHGKCGHLAETLRQELIHYMDRCRRKQQGIKGDPCDECLCDELRGHWYSGQCDPGSVWYDTGGGSGQPYTSPGECLIKSAINSCDLPCKFVLVPPAESRKRVLSAFKKCALYSDFGKPFPPPFPEAQK